MDGAFTARRVAAFFAAVLALYLLAFYGCEYIRGRKGPWELQFQSDGSNAPSVVIYQPSAGISSVELLFHGEKFLATNARVAFDDPIKTNVPFGRVIYEDLTFRPGVVTFDFFGHEVELLPRVLIVNKKEVPWRSDSTIELTAAEKLAIPPQPPKKKGQ